MSGSMLNDPIRWINSASRPMILGLVAAVALCACDAPQETSEKNLFRSSSQPHLVAAPALRSQPQQSLERVPKSPSIPAGPAEQDDDGSEKASEPEAVATAPSEAAQHSAETPQREQSRESEREPEPNSDSQAAAPAPLKRIDPGAAYIARAIRAKIEARDPAVAATAPEEPIIIGIATIRNQSRARSAEFEAFLDRFAKLLTDAGHEQSVSFTTDSDQQTDYDLVGTAYLLSAEGFDWWELFLSLRPAHQSWTLWRCDHPVRVMRQPRPGHQQVFLTPLPRVRH